MLFRCQVTAICFWLYKEVVLQLDQEYTRAMEGALMQRIIPTSELDDDDLYSIARRIGPDVSYQPQVRALYFPYERTAIEFTDATVTLQKKDVLVGGVYTDQSFPLDNTQVVFDPFGRFHFVAPIQEALGRESKISFLTVSADEIALRTVRARDGFFRSLDPSIIHVAQAAQAHVLHQRDIINEQVRAGVFEKATILP